MSMTVVGRPNRFASALIALIALIPLAARADFHIRSPNEIDYEEWEFETNGSASFDHNPANNGETSYTAEIGRGITPWWHPELELDFGRDPGPSQPTQVQGLTWENTFQITEPGEDFVDFGIYWEYAYSTLRGSSDTTMIGPLLQKDIGRTTHTLNLFLEKGIGPSQEGHGLDFNYAWQSRWNVSAYASPAIEIYGDVGQLDHVPSLQNQQLIVGPVLVGAVSTGTSGQLKYELGYLFGATSASPAGTLRWKLEWEVHF